MQTAQSLHFRLEANGDVMASDWDAMQGLADDLRAIPRVSVAQPEAVPAPEGSKAAGMFELALAISASGALLPTIVTVVRDWLMRQPPAYSIRLKTADFEIDWTGHTPPEEIGDLLAAVARKATGP